MVGRSVEMIKEIAFLLVGCGFIVSLVIVVVVVFVAMGFLKQTLSRNFMKKYHSWLILCPVSSTNL